MAPVLLLAATLMLDVPFVPQERETCGAAALAMVLGYWQAPVAQQEIARELHTPELHGILGSRLAEFARGRGMTAIVYVGDLENLRDYVTKGRPLIVAWKLGRDRYHDVVVVGWDAEREEVLVHDPAEGGARRVRARTFDERWAAAGRWTLLVLPAAK